MKICYVNPTNAVRRPIAEISKKLAAEGHEITVMYPSNPSCPVKQWVPNDALESGAIKLKKIKSLYWKALRYSFPNFFSLFKETKAIFKENDRIHIWEYYYPISVVPLLYAALSKERRRKVILTTDGFVGYSYTPKEPFWLVPALRIYTQLFARFLFRIPWKMTTYGKAMLPFAKKSGVPMKKISVQGTGIHLDKFSLVKEEEVGALRKEFSIEGDEKVLLFVGMLTDRKGIEKIVEIGQKLLDEGLNVRTILVGDAHGENVWKKQVRPEHKEKIVFTGGRRDIPQLMRFADLLILPSEGEGLPGVVMEAMASKLAVVATDEGCTPDLIFTGKSGYLIPIGGDYYPAVKELLLDDEKRLTFAAEAHKRISQLDWKDVAPQYLSLYQN